MDIEVTEEEYKRIDESCVADIFEGMYEDPSLADICERVLDVIYLRFAEDDEGNPCSFYDLRDELDFLVMYPLEVMADNTMPDVFPEDFFPGEDML